jgi:phage repressor protein C with HTH and peptisase S24 domain
MNTPEERLVHLRKQNGLSFKALAEPTDVTGDAIRLAISRKSIKEFHVRTIAEHYNFNAEWILTGEGDKYKRDKNRFKPYNLPASGDHMMVNEAEPVYGNSVMYVPLVSKHAYAGFVGGYEDEEYVDDLPKVPFPVEDRAFKGRYVAFEIKGDSMWDGSYEGYAEGEIALCREIKRELWQSKLHTHKWPDYIIVHRYEGIMIKRISKHNVEDGIITAHSLNPLYEDRMLHLDEVMRLYNVIKTQKVR